MSKPLDKSLILDLPLYTFTHRHTHILSLSLFSLLITVSYRSASKQVTFHLCLDKSEK